MILQQNIGFFKDTLSANTFPLTYKFWLKDLYRTRFFHRNGTSLRLCEKV